MQQNSQKPNHTCMNINADAYVLFSIDVKACGSEVTPAPDHVYYSYSWLSGSITNTQGYETYYEQHRTDTN